MPSTRDTRCITRAYRSTASSRVTRRVPGVATRATSLRARSTSIMCSAFSLASSLKSASIRSSASPSARGRVPAIGLTLTTLSALTATAVSGEAPNSTPPASGAQNW